MKNKTEFTIVYKEYYTNIPKSVKVSAQNIQGAKQMATKILEIKTKIYRFVAIANLGDHKVTNLIDHGGAGSKRRYAWSQEHSIDDLTAKILLEVL